MLFGIPIDFILFALHLPHEWMILANLLCLLLGFALLSWHFEESQVPAILPKYLPDDWKGGFVLLAVLGWLRMSDIWIGKPRLRR